LPITCIDSPSIEDFNKLYENLNKPVLITGVVSKWRAVSLWNSQYFKSFAENRLVPVKRMKNGNYLGAKTEIMTLGEYLDKANACPTDEERLYLSEQSTDKIMPEVIDDYIPPPYINTSKFSAAFILVAICTLKYIFIHLEKRCFALFLGEKN